MYSVIIAIESDEVIDYYSILSAVPNKKVGTGLVCRKEWTKVKQLWNKPHEILLPKLQHGFLQRLVVG